jgi:hypothetical protein
MKSTIRRLVKKLQTRRSKIRSLQRDLDDLDARFKPEISAATNPAAAEDLEQDWAAQSSLLQEEIMLLETEILTSKTRFWRVPLPVVD